MKRIIKTIVFLCALIFIVSMMGIGQINREETDIDIYNVTENMIKIWNNNTFEYKVYNETMSVSEASNIRMTNSINKGAESLVYILFQVTGWGLEFGYNNPQYNFTVILNWILFFVFITLLPVFCILLALLYLMCKGFVKCINWIKEKWKRNE